MSSASSSAAASFSAPTPTVSSSSSVSSPLQSSASLQLRLSRLASISDYRVSSNHQRFRVPTEEIALRQSYQPTIPPEFLDSAPPAQPQPPKANETRFPLSPASVSRTYGRPQFSRVESSGPREVKIPYESRLGLRGASSVPVQPAPTKLFTHESPLLRDFFDHGTGKFVSENGVNVAQCYYLNRRPFGGRLKTEIPSRFTKEGRKYFTSSVTTK